MIVTAFSQQQATAYEKAVFDAVICLISPDRDDNVAYELLSNVRNFSHGIFRMTMSFVNLISY